MLRDLERRFRAAVDPAQRIDLADRLVPELVGNSDAERAALVLEAIDTTGASAEARARLHALRGVVSAMLGESHAADVEQALSLLPALGGPAAAVVLQRAAVAALHARDARTAEEQALASLALCDRHGLSWLGARAAASLYGLHYHLTGDLHAARFYAELATGLAGAASDGALRRACLTAQFDLACVFGDWDQAGSLRELLRRDRGPEAYTSGTPLRVGDALMLGSRGDFNAMRGHVEAALATETDSVDRALIVALHALALAGLGLKVEGRSAARRALGLSNAHGRRRDLLHSTIRRRLAGVLGAWASVIVGDTYHGSRALTVRGKWPGSTGVLAAALCAEARGASVDVQNRSLTQVRGYLILARTARQSALALEAATPYALTTTELDVLRGVAEGKTNSAIAGERGVSRNAVERRLMSAYAKLEVKTRGEAIAKVSSLLHSYR